MSNEFYIGQQVECINDDWDHPSWENVINKPVKGAVYTVRGFYEAPAYANCYLGMWLEEITNPQDLWIAGDEIFVAEISFETFRFRPLLKAEKKTDISALVELTKVREDELV